MSSEQNPPKVFISYSHDSQEHRLRVYELLRKLRADGIHCVTDHTQMSPPEGWQAWMEDRIKEADFTLVVCTETYRRRAERKEQPGVGLGVTWEATLITNEIYQNASRNTKFIPVLFSEEDITHRPAWLGQVSYYRVDLEDGYELLVRHLTNQPLFEEPPVAPRVRELPPITRQKDFDEAGKVEVNDLLSSRLPSVFRISDALVAADEHISVSVDLDAQGDENAFAFSLIFDTAHLKFIEAVLGKDANNATLNVNTALSTAGQIGLAMALPTGQCITAGKNKKLITVNFHIQTGKTLNESNIRFGDQPIAREIASSQANKLSASWLPCLIRIPSQPKIIALPKPRLRHKNFTEDLGNGVKLEMIAIPGGSFLMGSEDFETTKPVHKVTLSPFHIGKFQVTQAQWKAVMGNNPSHFKGDTLPVEQVSWDDAVSFCEKLSKQTGKTYRLPTEAEWEYSCLAGSTGKYCFGDDEALLKDYAWYGEPFMGKTHPVGEKLPNNWGLHDMHGNVWEWCQDWYDKIYYAELAKQGEAINPQGPANGEYRVLRGGSWNHAQGLARAVFRHGNRPATRNLDLGFRVLCCRPPSS